VIKEARHLIRLFLRTFGYKGITLPPWGIYILRDSLSDDGLVKHEQVHWAQYQARGVIKFYLGYLWLLMRHGYQNHPWEIEARNGVRS